MKYDKKDPPRKYKCGINNQVEISDCGRIELDKDEQVTFVTNENKEVDFARKSWGFYPLPSINGRLVNFGFKTALVKNSYGRIYINIVEKERMDDFLAYLKEERCDIVEWLDEKYGNG